MDPNTPSAPALISSLEALIQASVTSILNGRLSSTADTLDAQIQTAVTAALDRRLGLSVGSLGNRMMSLIEQRLGSAISTLDFRVNASVTAALDQRLGPAGSALTAQSTFTAAPPPVLSSANPPKTQSLGVTNRTEEGKVSYAAAEELGKTQQIGDDTSLEKKQTIQKECQKNIEPPEDELPAQQQGPARQSLDTGPIAQEQSDQKQTTTRSEASKTTSAGLDNWTMTVKIDERTGKETSAIQSGTSKSEVHPFFTNDLPRNKAEQSAVFTAKPNIKSVGLFSSANKTPAERKANEQHRTIGDNSGELDSSDEEEEEEEEEEEKEEESRNEKPKRKRAKIKLDPPGFTEGPPIKFRRVSPKLTAATKKRGYPRVVDLSDFTEASNKQNLTLADVVATVLFNYDPLSLQRFLDKDEYQTFHFIRKENDRTARQFAIERRRENYGVVVKVRGV